MGQFFEKSTLKRSQTRLFGSRVLYRPAIIWLWWRARVGLLKIDGYFARLFEEKHNKTLDFNTQKELEILICCSKTQ